MVKNIRWLYAKLGNTDFATTGTTVSGALKNLNTSVNGKANGSHKHTVSDIPATSQQINSDSYIPLSSLVYSMSQQIKSISDTFNSHINPDSVTEDLTIDYNMINVTDDITQMHVYSLTTSNTTSESHYLYNTDDFFNTFNRSTGYTNTNLDQKLYIGDVIIPAETNDVQQAWVVAGFDVEKNGITHEGSLLPYSCSSNGSLGYTTFGDSYDNGYGIALVLIDRFDINDDSADYSSYYTNYNSIYGTNGFDYLNSNINTSVIPLIVNDAKNIMFKDHIVERNIIAYTGEDVTADYSWTTAYGTLLDTRQLSPNSYDDSANTEASYILPISYYSTNNTLSWTYDNYLYGDGGDFGPVWIRNHNNTSDEHYSAAYSSGLLAISDLSMGLTSIETSLPIRPMIYVR